MLHVISMKKQKISKQINKSYEANFSNVDENIDYDDYIRSKKQAEYEKSLTDEIDITKQTLSEKKKAGRQRIAITKEKEELARKNLQETPLEKNDMKAMIIAAFITFGLPIAIIMLLLFGLAYLFFM